MVITVKKFLEKYINPLPEGSGGISDRSLKIATAALLLEMMRADARVTEDERSAVMKTVMSRFNLTREESDDLLQFAEQEIRKATGYYEFTSLINKGLAYGQKVKVIESLWEIAFADRCLDKYEEHMVRKIADLIYVEHKDFIEAKLRVKERLSL
ncbi:MAG TPA: TerB family tellurite resistance protein [Thermodesulfovibrionales bacterium]|nr:TerB family tellurite resistance protein [Thermodesulfovibrionales bacterium]